MANPGDTQLTLDEAYQATFLWLDHVGDPPLDISEPAHASVELRTARAVVRVRSSNGPVEQSSVLALLRAGESDKKMMLFSPSGFSAGALSIAETQGIALFSLDSHGRAVPETTHARAVSPETPPEPPFTPDDEDDIWAYTPPPQQDDPEDAPDGIDAATADWSDCPSCGTTHYRSAKFCKACGTRLQNDAEEEASKMRCRNCGSHDIEING